MRTAMPETIVLLHGFAGTGRAWKPVVAGLDGERYRALAPDLSAHDLASCVGEVLAAAPDRFALCGYSMGGRIALHVALAEPSRVSRLVLVATTAGIADAAERRARRAADEALVDRIAGGSIEEFAEWWMAQPVFAGTPDAAAALWREDLLRREPGAVAAQLRGLGTGVVPAVWERLGELTMPATVVVGERDAKYRALGERLASGLPDARLVVIPGAGHGLPREAPAALAQILAAASGDA
jgi:2-succinyl-6-hydroxy-2,4-cyclohexadiene-1-carboxylate synthase